MLREYFFRKRVRKFLAIMSTSLKSRYGGGLEFTEGQVKTTLSDLGYAEEYEEIAIAIFCDERVAKAYGIDDPRINIYRREHGNWSNGSCASGGGGSSSVGSDGGGD